MPAKVLMIMGPTASGKTQLVLTLAQQIPIEIISVDSALIYRGMDIGTAKPSLTEQAAVPHHLLDIRRPDQSYSVADFCHDAHALIQQISDRGRLAVLCGGTMLYFRALQTGLATLPEDPQIRQQLQLDLQQTGLAALHQRLCQLDAPAAQRIHAHDTQRILRALEINLISGRQTGEFYAEQSAAAQHYNVMKLGLWTEDRAWLHKRIAHRFDQMLQQGFVDEVQQLLKAYPNIHLMAFRSVGYRQIIGHLHGEISLDEARYRAIVATRQLAKRQFTWLRREPALHKIDIAAMTDPVLRQKLFNKIKSFWEPVNGKATRVHD